MPQKLGDISTQTDVALPADIVDSAAGVSANTTNFNGNLSVADDTVQKALDTFDNFTVPEGSPSQYESTVGPTGDYTTLGAAITAGKTRVLIIGDTTETADITLPVNFQIVGIGMNVVTIDMGNYNFSASSEYGIFKDLRIKIAYTTGQRLFSSSQLHINFIRINFDDLASTISYSARIGYMGKASFDNCVFNIADVVNGGVNISNSIVNRCYFYGGGNNVTGGIIYISRSTVNACVIDVDYASTAVSSIYFSDGSTINSLQIYASITTDGNAININNTSANIISFINNGGGYRDIKVEIGYSIINKIVVSDQTGYSSDFTITSTGSTLTGTGQEDITNIIASTGTVVDGISIDCPILVTGNDVSIVNSKIGAAAGGGTNTITVEAGAERTIIGNTRVDSDIIDNGTGTVADYIIY